MKVVIRKLDHKILYRSEPEFKEGFGIKNALAERGGKPEDYQEVDITDQQWQAHLDTMEKPYDPKTEIDAIRKRLELLEATQRQPKP
jgi:hypothetical protein